MGFDQYLEKLAKEKQETRAVVKSMLTMKPSQDQWRGLIAVPPGSMLESILSKFKKETDIPLELPFFAFLHFISGYLLSKRVKIESDTYGSFYPELWNIVLADSGSGKTFAHNILAKVSPVKSLFPEPASGAVFIKAFEEHNFGLWFQDEIAQKMKLIDTPLSPLSDIKEYLLRAYGNDKIERSNAMTRF